MGFGEKILSYWKPAPDSTPKAPAVPSDEQLALEQKLKQVTAKQEEATQTLRRVSACAAINSDNVRTVVHSLARRKMGADAQEVLRSAETAMEILEGRLHATSS